eukprot:6279278-Amphidinium_carterae.1
MRYSSISAWRKLSCTEHLLLLLGSTTACWSRQQAGVNTMNKHSNKSATQRRGDIYKTRVKWPQQWAKARPKAP